MGSRLAAKEIPYEISPDGGSVLVPSEKLDAARLETAAQGLPRNARLGFELFDTPNWAGSDFSEKVNYQRALEGELERTLQTLSEVEAVRVHLVLPRESLFSEQEHVSKAAVIVKTRRRHALPGGATSHPATGCERSRWSAAGKRYGRRCGHSGVISGAARSLRPGVLSTPMKNWPPPPCMPSSRSSAPNTSAPACTSTMT